MGVGLVVVVRMEVVRRLGWESGLEMGIWLITMTRGWRGPASRNAGPIARRLPLVVHHRSLRVNNYSIPPGRIQPDQG